MTERDIFIAALQQDDPARRRAYLDGACARQPELRRQVEDLLRLYQGAGSFLEKPAATGPVSDAAEQASSGEAPGALLGRESAERSGDGPPVLRGDDDRQLRLSRHGSPVYGMMHQPFTGEFFSGDGASSA